MAAKLFLFHSSPSTLGFVAVIISWMVVVHAFLTHCEALSSLPVTNGSEVGSEAQGKTITFEHKKPETLMNELTTKDICVYTITTVTGKKWGAGTDSTISLRLYNNGSQVVFFPSLDNANNNFEKGKVDKFEELGNCVDHICKLVLYTDNSGFMPAWFVDSLSVSMTTSVEGMQTTTWQLHEWLPKDNPTAAFFDVRDNCV